MTNQLTDEQWGILSQIIYLIDDGKLEEPFTIHSVRLSLPDYAKGDVYRRDYEGKFRALREAGMLEFWIVGYSVAPAARAIIQSRRDELLAKLESQPPVPPTAAPLPSPSAATGPHERRVYLAQFLDAWFSMEELQNLCVELNVDFHNLRGEIKETKAIDLVAYLHKHDRLAMLERALAAKRPERYEPAKDNP